MSSKISCPKALFLCLLLLVPGLSRAAAEEPQKTSAVPFEYPKLDWRAGIPAGYTKSFHIKYKGRRVGFHHIEFFPDNENLVVKIHLEIIVRLGFIKLVDFRHDSVEYWENGQLAAMVTETKEQGKRRYAKLVMGEDGIVIEGSRFTGIIDIPVKPASFWNPETLAEKQLINHQNGEVIDVETVFLGRRELDVLGKTVNVLKYSFAKGDAYFTGDGEWVGGAFRKKRDAVYEICDKSQLPPKRKWHYASDILLKENPFE